MRRTIRGAALALVACACSLSGCSSGDPVQHCQSASECPSNARCVSQACVANSPPVAAFAIPGGTLEEFALLTFDAASSYDPDAPGDSIASYAWSFESVGAACAAPQTASTAREATVRFGCPGTYAVTLVAADEMTARSAPATRQVTIASRSGASLVEVGADVVRGHACAGTPLVCTQVGGDVQLSAVAAAGAPTGLSYGWSVEPPPNRPLGAARRVTFSPSASVAAPTVRVETDGTAVSGDWIFRMEARDAAGVVAAQAMRLTIGNTDPVVTATVPASFAHAFSASLSRFTSEGVIPVAVSDPDGDPLVDRIVEWRHAGDGGATFAGQDLVDRVSFGVVVPYTQVSDALFLREGVGLSRSIEFSVADVNGAVVRRSWPIAIGNQPPRTSYGSTVPVDHSFDATAMRYQADAVIGTWVDDDGDPAVHWRSTGNAQCPTVEVSAGSAVVRCSMAYPGTPAAQQFTGSHLVEVALGDPWGDATPAAAVIVTVGNRAPVVLSQMVSVPVSCTRTQICCDWSAVDQVCYGRDVRYGSGSGSTIPGASDPDGDPLIVREGAGTPYTAVTAADLLPVTGSVPAGTYCSSSPPITSETVTADDGIASATGTIYFSSACQ